MKTCKYIKLRLFFVAIYLISFPIFAQEIEKEISVSQPKDHFYSGIQFYQKNEFQKAFNSFELGLSAAPNHPELLFNFGLSAEKLKKLGLSIGAWRKAVLLDSSLMKKSQVFEKVNNDLQKKYKLLPFKDPITKANRLFLNKLHIQLLIGLLLLVSFYFGHRVIRFLAQQKEAYLNNNPLPKILAKDIYTTLLFVLLLSFAGLKIAFITSNKATVITASTTLKSAPSKDSSTLLEVYESQNLILKKEVSPWVQVELPQGLKGWVLKKNLFQHWENPLW